MTLASLSRPLLAAVTFALVAAVSLGGSTGCGKVACFKWSSTQGKCPTAEEAMAQNLFGDPQCGGEIDDVDGRPEFDGELCCYDYDAVRFQNDSCPPDL